MAKELAWVCALLPQELNRQLVELCREENQSIGLPEDVFRFPLHISMKKSFQTTEFEAVKAEILHHIQTRGKIYCRTTGVACHKKMLWLPVEPVGEVKRWHDQLDQRLLGKFAIPIDRFDANFAPHISLFTKGDQVQMKEMGLRLARKIFPTELTLSRFVVGSSRHGDEFFDI
jgi:2'-5' RNA ligase